MAREALDRHRHRQHQLVLVVHPLGAGGLAGQGVVHFLIDAPVLAAFEIGRAAGRRGARPSRRHRCAATSLERGSSDRAAASSATCTTLRGSSSRACRSPGGRWAVEPRAQPRRRDQLAQQRFGFSPRSASGFLSSVAYSASVPATMAACCWMPVSRSSTRPRPLDLHHDHAAGQDQQRQGVEGDDAPGEGGEVGKHAPAYSL